MVWYMIGKLGARLPYLERDDQLILVLVVAGLLLLRYLVRRPAD